MLTRGVLGRHLGSEEGDGEGRKAKGGEFNSRPRHVGHPGWDVGGWGPFFNPISLRPAKKS